MPHEALNEVVLDVPISLITRRALYRPKRLRFSFHRHNRDISQPKPVPHTHFPSGHYRHRRHTLDLNKFLRLLGRWVAMMLNEANKRVVL